MFSVLCGLLCGLFFFFKQKTAYEIVSRDWSSDVCSSDLTINTKYALTCVYSTGKSDCLVLPKVFCIGIEIGQNTMKELTIFGLIMPKTLLQHFIWHIDQWPSI